LLLEEEVVLVDEDEAGLTDDDDAGFTEDEAGGLPVVEPLGQTGGPGTSQEVVVLAASP
jgi:hypothetical protein